MSDTEGRGPHPETHDRRGKFAKGNNARTLARAKRRRGLERYLAQETNNGLEAGKVVVGIMRTEGHKQQFDAACYVIDALAEKLPDKVEVSGPGGKPLHPLSEVDVADLLALAKAGAK